MGFAESLEESGVPLVQQEIESCRSWRSSRIKFPPIKHGGEALDADLSEQFLDMFASKCEDVTILIEFSVRGWYENKFGGRKTLG
jgi:hypothetical protein